MGWDHVVSLVRVLASQGSVVRVQGPMLGVKGSSSSSLLLSSLELSDTKGEDHVVSLVGVLIEVLIVCLGVIT